jgi:hypothetical protein
VKPKNLQAFDGTHETDWLWISFYGMHVSNHVRSPFVLDRTRTQREHALQQREMMIMWFKDAAAGVSLVVFLASSYLLVPVAQAIVSAL